MPDMFGMCFRKFKIRSNTTPRILADADGFVSLPKIKHGELFKIFFLLKFGPNEKKLCLTRIRHELSPVIQADTAITECCNFLRDSLALEKDRDM